MRQGRHDVPPQRWRTSSAERATGTKKLSCSREEGPLVVGTWRQLQLIALASFRNGSPMFGHGAGRLALALGVN